MSAFEELYQATVGNRVTDGALTKEDIHLIRLALDTAVVFSESQGHRDQANLFRAVKAKIPSPD